MYRIKNLLMLLVLIPLFFSCDLMFNDDEDSSINYTMDEDYAGDWYTEYVDPDVGDSVLIYSFTDTSLSISIYIYSLGMRIEVGRGTINKISETTMEYQVTHEWSGPGGMGGSLVKVDRQLRIVDYSVSLDGTTLTFDGETYSSTDPRD